MKVMDFSGSAETLIKMFEHDIIAPELKKLDRNVKVAMIILVEEEPYFVPDNDDISITKTGEDIRPQVNFGDIVPPDDPEPSMTFCSEGIVRLDDWEWSTDGKEWHAATETPPLGRAICRPKRAVVQDPVQIVDDLRFGDVMERDQLNVQFDGADEMMGQSVSLAGSYRISEPFGTRPAALYRPNLTKEDIAILEGRGDDSEVVGT